MKQDVFDYLRNDLGLDEGDAAPLYEAFVESFNQTVGDLRATDPSDFDGIRRVTHAIIGFSQNLGAKDLFEAAKTLNASAHACNTASCEKGIAAIFALHDAYMAP